MRETFICPICGREVEVHLAVRYGTELICEDCETKSDNEGDEI